MFVCLRVYYILPFACFLYVTVHANENHADLPEGIGISGKEAKSFLGSSPAWCIDPNQDANCEQYYDQCYTEDVRKYFCTITSTVCPPGLTCSLQGTKWCAPHNQTYCTQICDPHAPGVSGCKNGGTCSNINSTYFACNCVPGYTGSDCSTNINECESDPCQHAGICKDGINDYNCTCSNRYDGKDCEIDRCKVGPADVVFLVDSSISQESGNFNKQLNFIKDFVQSVYIGPNFVQVSVITFSFVAAVEFDLTSHKDNSSMLAAMDNIEYKPGATYTGAALSAARTVLLQSTRMVRKYVIVLTDGMSSNILDTKYQAALLKVAGVNIVAIGIGSQILHKELIDIASDDDRVFTVSNHDGLNNIQTQIGSYVCEVCLNEVSDVLYLLDASSSVALSEFQGALDALQHITSIMTIGRDKVRVSLVRYATEPEFVFDFQKYTSAIEMQPKISVLYRYPIPANHTKALGFVYNNGFTDANGAREGKRQVIIFLTNGNNMDTEASNQLDVLKNEGKIVVAIGHGDFVNREKLLNISSYPYMFYHLGEDQYTDVSVLNSLKGLIEYNTCNL